MTDHSYRTNHSYQTRSRSSRTSLFNPSTSNDRTQSYTQSNTQSNTPTPPPTTPTPTLTQTPTSTPTPTYISEVPGIHVPNNGFRLPQFARYVQILAFSATCVLLHNLLNVHYVRQCGLWFFESAYCRIVNRVLTLLQTSPLLIIGVLFQDAERG